MFVDAFLEDRKRMVRHGPRAGQFRPAGGRFAGPHRGSNVGVGLVKSFRRLIRNRNVHGVTAGVRVAGFFRFLHARLEIDVALSVAGEPGGAAFRLEEAGLPEVFGVGMVTDGPFGPLHVRGMRFVCDTAGGSAEDARFLYHSFLYGGARFLDSFLHHGGSVLYGFAHPLRGGVSDADTAGGIVLHRQKRGWNGVGCTLIVSIR